MFEVLGVIFKYNSLLKKLFQTLGRLFNHNILNLKEEFLEGHSFLSTLYFVNTKSVLSRKSEIVLR